MSSKKYWFIVTFWLVLGVVAFVFLLILGPTTQKEWEPAVMVEQLGQEIVDCKELEARLEAKLAAEDRLQREMFGIMKKLASGSAEDMLPLSRNMVEKNTVACNLGSHGSKFLSVLENSSLLQ